MSVLGLADRFGPAVSLWCLASASSRMSVATSLTGIRSVRDLEVEWLNSTSSLACVAEIVWAAADLGSYRVASVASSVSVAILTCETL